MPPESPNFSEAAEAAFAKLPPEHQERIRAEGDAISERVSNHVVQILIGRPGGGAPAEEANHASGVIAHTGTRLCLFTAQHVLAGYRNRRKEDTTVVFQAGNVSFDPEPRVLFESVPDDLVALGMNDSDQARIPAPTWRCPSWPPPAPRVDEFVAFAGLPIDYRINEGTEVAFAILGGILRVIGMTGNSFKCHVNRETIIKTRGPHVPPPGTNLGGMSGGPAFRLVDGSPELCGVITDFGPTFEVFMMAPLAIATTL